MLSVGPKDEYSPAAIWAKTARRGANERENGAGVLYTAFPRTRGSTNLSTRTHAEALSPRDGEGHSQADARLHDAGTYAVAGRGGAAAQLGARTYPRMRPTQAVAERQCVHPSAVSLSVSMQRRVSRILTVPRVAAVHE